MFEGITPDHSVALDVIIRARHSVRAFSSNPPSQEAIEAIIQAGLLAPFGALAVAGKPDFRKVFVIRNSSASMEAAANILKNRMAKQAYELEKKVGSVPFVQNLKRIGQQGVPGVGSAPYFIVARRKKRDASGRSAIALLLSAEYVAESNITGDRSSTYQCDDSNG